MNGEEFAQLVGCSPHILLKLKVKNKMKGNRLTVDLVPVFKELYKEYSESKKCSKNNYSGYKKALNLLNKQGYIDRPTFLRVFGESTSANILSYFEAMNNPLYSEIIKVRIKNKDGKMESKRVKVYKLFNKLKEEYKKENEMYGLPKKNGFVATNQRSSF